MYSAALRTEEKEARLDGLGLDNWETTEIFTNNFIGLPPFGGGAQTQDLE